MLEALRKVSKDMDLEESQRVSMSYLFEAEANYRAVRFWKELGEKKPE
jgi:hypothetical protein